MMNPERWVHVKAIVQEALEHAPDERAGTFIDAPLSPAAAARIVSELERSAHKGWLTIRS